MWISIIINVIAHGPCTIAIVEDHYIYNPVHKHAILVNHPIMCPPAAVEYYL